MLAEAATEARSYDAILEALYPLAADYDITVDRELATLSGRVHKDHLEQFTELFIDALTRPAFQPGDFNRIRSEAKNYLENTLRYSSDEEMAKAVLYSEVFAGTRYAHPEEGTVAGLEAITLDDTRAFYRSAYAQSAATLGIAGDFGDALVDRLQAALATLPPAAAATPPDIVPAVPHGNRLIVVDKPGADASISIGFPIGVHRGERDFYALWIANSWLGEHRNSASHLFQVIREKRGLNYGDYSYIECFPDGGSLQMPPVNVARRQQIFEIWIRTVPVPQAPFAIRAALREFRSLCDSGMTPETFDLTRQFVKKYSAHFAPAPADRLGYAIDDRFYAFADPTLPDEGHLPRFRRMMDELTLDDVNSAICRHLRNRPLTIAVVSGEADALLARLTSGEPTPIEYETEVPAAILEEDRDIAAFPLAIDSSNALAVPLTGVFAGNAND